MTLLHEPVEAERAPLLRRPLTSYYLVLGATSILLAIGLVMVLSASSVTMLADKKSTFKIFDKQVQWACIGVPAFFVASRAPLRWYRRAGYPLLLLSIALLLLVPVLGSSAYGAQRWIDLGPVQLQPSEFTKLAVILWGADLFVRKRRLLGDWRHLLIPFLPGVLAIATLVMGERDMGTTLVVLTISFALLWIVGAPGRIMAGLGALGAAGVSVLAIVEPYRLARITAFLNPTKDASDAGFQAIQGKLALASGGLFGVGLGASRQKWNYVPNAYTDFIMSIIGEELGLVGCLAIVALFGILAYAGVRIARRNADPFARLVAGGVTAWMLGQAVINMGAVVGLLPITGIPLPLISFGGSALVTTLFALGLLASLARGEPGVAEALAARGPVRERLRRRLRRAEGRAAPTTVIAARRAAQE